MKYVSFSNENHAAKAVGSNLKFHVELMKWLNDSTLNVNIRYITESFKLFLVVLFFFL